MPRTYRHNLEKAAQLEPDRCEVCKEFAAEHIVRSWTLWGVELPLHVCGDCLEPLVSLLKQREIEYRVGHL